ncbi:MAG: WYL domain-containing protein [Clostridiales bacterium]|nr:WYL domain-containing protein [Clostridiales bacterium]
MIFSELYGAYYGAVAAILKAASDHPLKKDELRQIVGRYAFGDSILSISSALEDGRWQVLGPDGRSVLRNPPDMPLTALEKSWLNAVSADPRVRLFTDEPPYFPDVPPLFTQDDILLFDRFSDGDPYGDEGYVSRFRMILAAIREKRPLRIGMMTRRGKFVRFDMSADKLEYSEKDDKFRLIGIDARYGRRMVNLGRVTESSPSSTPGKVFARAAGETELPEQRMVEFELRDERKALERALLHFAHFRKEAEKIEEGRYRIRVTYDAGDDTEMVIRVLSFGPMIRVISPDVFVEAVKERLTEQKNCGL